MPSAIEFALRSVVNEICPEVILRARRAILNASVFKSRGVVFVHVPKVAGTSVADAVYGRFIGHLRLQDILSFCPQVVCNLPRFSMTRNPWDRAVSAWSFARAGGSMEGPIPVRIHKASQYRRPELASFERFVESWLSQRNVEKLDGVFKPQSLYLTDKKGNAGFDHLGRFEELNRTEEWLSDILHEKIVFGRYNYSERDNFKQYYNANTRRIIGDLYRSDIERFGYEFD